MVAGSGRAFLLASLPGEEWPTKDVGRSASSTRVLHTRDHPRTHKGGRLSRKQAVTEIFPLTYRRVLRILKGGFNILSVQDQEDQLQEVMLRVVRSLHTYDPSRARFLNWLD